MTIRQPFAPSYGRNQVVTPAAASVAITIQADAKQVRIVNTGANIAYFRTYSSLTTPAPAATTADCPIAAGESIVVTKDEQHDRLAHISAAGTTLQVMTGEGGH